MLWTHQHVVFQISHAKVAARVVADAVDAGEAAAVEADDGDVAAAAFCMESIARLLRWRARSRTNSVVVDGVAGIGYCIDLIDGIVLLLLLLAGPLAVSGAATNRCLSFIYSWFDHFCTVHV